ncbi:MAG TPA: sulfatase, partial [Planctomycetes bacterium]|nr:sulfatase [Planctomycetota bacterium]
MSPGRGEGGSKRPNIIFIMSDDHAAHALSCYGSRINKTPHLDRLAREGMRFDHCYATNSLCAPSRATILTGKYNHINGLLDNRVIFDGRQETFPKILRRHGYQTAMIGKWHLKSTPTGFDYWNVLPGQGRYHDPVLIEMGERKVVKGYVTDLLTDFAIDFLDKKRDPDKPFLMMLHHKAPHRNWQPDKKHAHLYDNVEIPTPPTFDDDHSHRASPARTCDMSILHTLTVNDVKAPFP